VTSENRQRPVTTLTAPNILQQEFNHSAGGLCVRWAINSFPIAVICSYEHVKVTIVLPPYVAL